MLNSLNSCPFCGEFLRLLGDHNYESGWNFYGHAMDSTCILKDIKLDTEADMQTPCKIDALAWNTRNQ